MKLRYLAGALALSATIATTACGDDPPPTTPTPSPDADPSASSGEPRADRTPRQLAGRGSRSASRRCGRCCGCSTRPPTWPGRAATRFQVSDDPDFAPRHGGELGRYFPARVRPEQHSRGRRWQDAVRGRRRAAADDALLLARPRRRHGRRSVVGDGDVPHAGSKAITAPAELFDPLTDASTVGAAVGNVTLTPGRGVTINTNDSHVRYNLVRTITAGEFSVRGRWHPERLAGDKTKMIGDVRRQRRHHTSDWRLTVEKRDGGVIAWRFIAGEPEDEQIDTVGNERVALNFNPGTTYFWRATWRGGFDLNIFEGGMAGNRIYASARVSRRPMRPTRTSASSARQSDAPAPTTPRSWARRGARLHRRCRQEAVQSRSARP